MSGEPRLESNVSEPTGLPEHFFRREFGRLVSLLTRKVGVRHIELVEDAVQNALLSALTIWTSQGLPSDAGAWLYRVAHNHLIAELRRKVGQRRILDRAIAELSKDAVVSDAHFAAEVSDDLLRMLFICCDDALPRESQLGFALKSLCGFSVPEIAVRLFTTEANVYKRLARARAQLRKAPADLQTPSLEELTSRLSSVHVVLYLLFNEGYLSSQEEFAIRRELCDEAVRLATLLAEHSVGAVPETFALLALMHLHAARLDSRCDGTGGLLLLDEQDRSRWDRVGMAAGAEWLQRSAQGEAFSRYHAEAAIAAAHCFAPTFAETRWDEIAELYEMLERIAPSPLNLMNRAVAMAEWQGPAAGLSLLQAHAPPSWLAGSYVWNAVASDLHRRTGEIAIARSYLEKALASAPTDAVRVLLRRRLATEH